MIATRPRSRREIRLLVADRGGGVREIGTMSSLADHLRGGDVLVVNDAATLPASFDGRLAGTDHELEVRLIEAPDADGQARAVLFGPGSWRQRTEDRPAPPRVTYGDTLQLGSSLQARVVEVLGHHRLVRLEFAQRGAQLWTRLLGAGRPIQYSYVEVPLAAYDVQTAYAGVPFAAEMPSAGYGLSWSVLGALRAKHVHIAYVTHAAGLSSTGDASLDARLPLGERSQVSESTAARINEALTAGRRVLAVGTSVVRALESFVTEDGRLQAGAGETTLRLDRRHRLRVVSGILTGMHAKGESHYDLLETFAPAATLEELARIADRHDFSSHEFGDALLLMPALLPLPRAIARGTATACV